MDVFVKDDKGLRLPLSGTFSANPITMTAGYVAMLHFEADQVKQLNALADYARENVAAAIKSADVPACVTGTGSLFRIHLKLEAPKNYRDSYLSPARQKALGKMVSALYDNGIMMIHTASAVLSTAMEKTDIDQMCEAVQSALLQIKPILEENE